MKKCRVLISSVLTIALCLSLVSGATFALFTDKSETNVAVTSGKVNVVATASTPTITSLNGTTLAETSAVVNGNTVSLNNIVPGDTVSFDINIKNNSNVSVKYRTIIGVLEDNGLWEGLEVWIDDVEFSGTKNISNWEVMPAEKTVNVKISLPEDASNEYQGKTCKLYYNVEAVQGNANPANTDVWNNGDVTSAPEKEDNVYHITSAAEFIQYIDELNNERQNGTHRYDMASVVLDNDIDLNGYVFEVRGEGYAYTGSFDGQGHTVSNYTVKRTDNALYTGLFSVYMQGGSVKNLTIKNSTVIGQAQVSAIATVEQGGVIENCHVYDSTLIGEKKVGVVSGYNNQGTVKNCTATNCDVYASDSRAEQASVFGYENTGSTFVDNVATNVNVYTNTSGVTSAAELKAALLAGGHVVIVNDIDLGNAWETVYVQNKDLTVNGGNYSITGLNAPLINFYGGTITVNNMKVVNANVTANGGLGSGVILEQAQWANLYMNNCHVINAKLNAGDTRVGALVGYLIGGAEIKNCSVEDCELSAEGSVAAIIGHHANQGDYLQNTLVENCTVKNNELTAIDTGWRVGTVIGTVAGNINISNCVSTGNRLVQEGNTNPNHELFGRISGGTLKLNGGEYVADGVTKNEAGEYLISNANGMFWLAEQVNVNGKSFNYETVKLTADIDLQNRDWTPIGNDAAQKMFYGTFDGQNHVISNLKVTDTRVANDTKITDGVGLFGWLNGDVKNLKIHGATVTGYHNVGVIAGYLQIGTIENCEVKNATVIGNHIDANLCGDKVGGIVGVAYTANANTAVKNCKVIDSSITGGRDIGRIAGAAVELEDIIDCSATNVTVGYDSDCNDHKNLSGLLNGLVGRDI